MRIAFFSPLPPARTGIADYSVRLISLLANKSQIICFHDQPTVNIKELPSSISVYRTSRFDEINSQEPFDILLYQLGNSAHHAFMYPFLQSYPGVIDCHDVNLHHFLTHCLSKSHSGEQTYAGYLDHCHGGKSSRLARLAAAGLFHESQCFLFPLDATCLTRESWLIVHSQYACVQVLLNNPEVPVSNIPPPCQIPERLDTWRRAELKEKLGFDKNDILICSFGEILPKKGCFELLESFQTLMNAHPNIYLVFVGSLPAHNRHFQQQTMDHQPRIRLTGYVDPECYQNYLEVADIGVNLRFPSVGETSQTMLDLMARGIPAVITNSHAGHEVPDNCALKILPGNQTTKMLTTALMTLLDDTQVSTSLAANARSWIIRQHNPKLIAEIYRDVLGKARRFFVDKEISSQTRSHNLLDTVQERWLQRYMARLLNKNGWETPQHDHFIHEITARLPAI